MPNRLAEESSLYLRQHANNPVDWYPWGKEAFARAKEEDKPLLVSIGYSSCHWCHVMAHESFENEYIAGLMNQHFICVKVDREERPDVDQIYMEAVQMIARHGGWPLNAFCFPDGRPFFGGTYFPPEDRGNNMVPWPQLLMRVRDYYQREREKLEENAENIVHNLTAMNTPVMGGADVLDAEALVRAANAVVKNHDDDFGGFGDAPKFPPSMTLDFLLETHRLLQTRRPAANAESDQERRLDQVIETTLKGMAHGGLYDQVGGGFTSYSTDRFWLIPHFEKMLYDNGLLLRTYGRAWRRYRDPLYRAVAEETADWAMREMLSADTGLFSASIDADSEGEEGKFYLWTPEEVRFVLGDEDGRRFRQAYNITEAGNFEHGKSNPALTAAEFGEREALAGTRKKLLEAREKRVRPATDPKHLVSWNSLMISGLAEAGFALDRPDLFAAARRAADFIWDNLRFDENRLKALYHEQRELNGYLDDYAFFGEALLTLNALTDLFEPGTSRAYLKRAEAVAAAVEAHFSDPEAVGYFFTSDDHESLVARRKEWWDNAMPAGNSSLLHLFSRLYALTGNENHRKAFSRLKKAYPGFAAKMPHGIPHALAAVAAETAGLAVLKVKGIDDLTELAAFLRDHTWQDIRVQVSDDPNQPDGYQLCVGTTCLAPATTVEALKERL